MISEGFLKIQSSRKAKIIQKNFVSLAEDWRFSNSKRENWQSWARILNVFYNYLPTITIIIRQSSIATPISCTLPWFHFSDRFVPHAHSKKPRLKYLNRRESKEATKENARSLNFKIRFSSLILSDPLLPISTFSFHDLAPVKIPLIKEMISFHRIWNFKCFFNVYQTVFKTKILTVRI